MSELNRRLSRRKLLSITIPSVSLFLGGCGELSPKDLKQQKIQFRKEQANRVPLRNILKKVKKGYEGAPPSEKHRPGF
jgi:hypothetical protein